MNTRKVSEIGRKDCFISRFYKEKYNVNYAAGFINTVWC